MKGFDKIWMVFLGLVLLSASCQEEQARNPKVYSKEELLEINKSRMSGESERIDAYIVQNDLEMQKTETGLRYHIYHAGNGPKPTATMVATITYHAFLLDGTKVESTDFSGPKKFRIEHDDVISGLHEGVLLLSVGDSARFIIPSHLAHGLTGDKNIPSNATLIYDVALLEIQ